MGPKGEHGEWGPEGPEQGAPGLSQKLITLALRGGLYQNKDGYGLSPLKLLMTARLEVMTRRYSRRAPTSSVCTILQYLLEAGTVSPCLSLWHNLKMFPGG